LEVNGFVNPNPTAVAFEPYYGSRGHPRLRIGEVPSYGYPVTPLYV